MITAHPWRPDVSRRTAMRALLNQDRPCGFMNCARPRTEHERAWRPKGGPR